MRFEQLSKDEVKKAPKLTRNFISRIFHYLNPYRSQYLLSLFLVVVSAILSIIPTLLTGEMIDRGIIGGNFKLLLVFAGASFGLLIVSSLVSVLSSYLSAYIGQHVSKDMSEEMYGHLQQMSHQFFTSNKQGEIQSRMMQDISGVESVITQTFTTLMSNIMTLAVAFVAMMGKDIRLAIIALVIVPLMIVPMKKAGQARWDLTMQARKEADKTQQLLNESLSVSGQLLTKLFVREENEMREYQTLNTNLVNLNIRERVAGRGFRGLMQVITNMGPLILYVVGGYLIIYRQSSLTIGDITVMVTLLGRLIFPIDSLMNVQVDLVRSTALFNRIFEYLDMKPEIISEPDAVKRKTLKGDMEFEQVYFQYSKEKAVLHDLSFHVAPGSSLALVGPSGAGKSTITNLIPRLFDVTSGQIKIDGTNIKEYDLASLRLNIGVVTQETYLFNGTIRENLLIANPEATDEDLILALEKAHLTNFLKSLPEGLDTIVGNRGMKLSGGEKQRVSIARVILKQPAILIFDEATSSLDSLSEEEIQKEIVPLMDSCTTIMVAHRLSTIRHAEQIIVLEEGSIQQQGTHEELIEQPGLYQRLYQTQMGKDKRV
ncbi:ABC transporter ATP-binding protein [Jeotgalibaca ciconiae]|uniref:ABC transporter ATP-binding protein n=1 Tax=Jeotgalibaca ciconiae TaxID=2496265 RepID=A0A3Q9BM46_9LACT|nr:ABC transporter ATP-binding protein [Jeotgalibaca ciconiae]AZP05629.1 ABC transporter ATP-binding protein [Jeotgalibaca ciconiae]